MLVENPLTNPMGSSIFLDSPDAIQKRQYPHIRMVPHIGPSHSSFVFDIIDKELEPGIFYRMGRFSDRNYVDPKFSFKSKVVSRNHAEMWTEGEKVFIRDIGSSSGTFVNGVRISAPNQESGPFKVENGDILQLGTDYQGGIQLCYRAVRIRMEINRVRQNDYTRTAFQQFVTRREECCICLSSIAPFQALFVAPCSHFFHFKCLRPLIVQSYPGFCCPLCRHYSDLETSVDEVDLKRSRAAVD